MRVAFPFIFFLARVFMFHSFLRGHSFVSSNGVLWDLLCFHELSSSPECFVADCLRCRHSSAEGCLFLLFVMICMSSSILVRSDTC